MTALRGKDGKFKHKRKMTPLEEAFVANLQTGMSRGDAMKMAGYRGAHARTYASEVMRKPDVRAVLMKALKREGVTTTKLARVVRRGLEAKKTQLERMSDGTLIRHREPDWSSRHKFVDTAAKLMDVYPAAKIDVEVETYESFIIKNSSSAPTIDAEVVAYDSSRSSAEEQSTESVALLEGGGQMHGASTYNQGDVGSSPTRPTTQEKNNAVSE